MSPLLFNLFIESLQRYLETVLPGLEITPEFRLHSLLYADDIAIPCNSIVDIQIAATAIHHWCTAWGLVMGIGRSKTEVVPFPHAIQPGVAPVLPPPVPLPDGRQIPWAHEYTYLGYTMKYDLSDDGLTDRILNRMKTAENRYFRYTSYVRQACPALAFQIINTTVVGAASYLLCIAEPTQRLVNGVNDIIASVARKCQVVPSKVPSSSVWLDGRLPRALGLVMRDRTRMFLTLQHTPFQHAIAPRMFRALLPAALAAGLPQRAYRTTLWTAQTIALFDRVAQRLGIPRPIAANFGEVRRRYAVYGRAVMYQDWQREVLARVDNPTQWYSTMEPPGGNPLRHIISLCGGDVNRIGLMGDTPYTTPVSCRGPGGMGNILAHATCRLPKEQVTRLLASRAGRIAFFFVPLLPPEWHTSGFVRLQTHEDWRRAGQPGHCPVCHALGLPGSSLHDWHVVSACCGMHVLLVRAVVILDIAQLCSRILRMLREASARMSQDWNEGEVGPEVEQDCANIVRLVEEINWDTTAAQALLHRLVTIQPWSEVDIPVVMLNADHAVDPAVRVLAILGREFDVTVVQPRFLRKLADMWCPWALSRFEQLTIAWARDAVNGGISLLQEPV